MKVKSLISIRPLRQLMLLGMLALMPATGFAQAGMTDEQVIDLIQSESKAGRTQAQIVTKLIQRGVRIDQIRRLRNLYDRQIAKGGYSRAADGAVSAIDERMRSNNDGTSSQELNTAKKGTTGEIESDAAEEHDIVERDVQAMQNTAGDAQGKRVFGRDIFNRRSLSFEPNMNIATPQNYVLGPGDKVLIDVYGASQKTMSLTISPEGTVTIPNYGPVELSGLTVAAAQARIRSKIGPRYASSDIKLTVGQTRTILINVMGEVKKPGTYHLSAFASVFHALYVAGGISNLGTLRNIRVIRGGKNITIVDIYEYILNGRLAGDIRLQEGDVIQVDTYDCLVGITGNVKRPMFYEMRKSESVATLIKYAGGFSGDAYKKSVRLVRQTGERYSVHNVEEFEQSSFQLEDGDAVEVDGLLNRYENVVEIKGAVFRPGQFRLGRDVTTVRSLIDHAEGLTEDAFTAHAVLHRLKADRSLEVLPVDVAGIMGGTVADIPLQNEDVLFIPTVTDLRLERTLTIRGQVLSPGTYEFADNTTIEDLIIQAGGLKDNASTARVDVSRRIRDPKALESGSVISKTYQFSIKDGFVIDGEPGFVLEPYDVVQVRKSPGFFTPRQVHVEGEVNFEGGFTLERKNQHLTDLVKMAGGLTPDAYVRGARLYRKMNDDEKARMRSVLAAARLSQSDEDSVALKKLQTSETFIVGIQLDKALEEPGSDYDIVIREGDRLVIPEYNGTVRVSGDVMFPNTVTYEEGKDYKWYVNKAGGFGHRSKKSKTYVIYQNGTLTQVGHKAKIEPGCEIVVPSKHQKEAISAAQWMGIGTSAASIASMIATIVYMTTR